MAQAYSKRRRRANADQGAPALGLTAVSDKLEQVVRDGAERLLAEMLELEVAEFLQRLRYKRNQVLRGYRNGYAPERTIGVGLGKSSPRAAWS